MYFQDPSGADILKFAIEIRASWGIGATKDELANLLMASAKNQIHIIKTPKGEPIAYFAFAKISKYSLAMLASGDKKNLISYEMNEGRILYILDVVILKGRSKSALTGIRKYARKFRLVAFEKRGSIKILYRTAISFRRLVRRF